jgi:hypothetical protein
MDTNPEKNRQYQRDWYYRNQGKKKAAVKARREQIRVDLLGLRGNRCVVCGETAIMCLQFHHRDPSTKLFDISAGIRRGLGWNLILAEAEKCDIYCSNCHLKETSESY